MCRGLRQLVRFCALSREAGRRAGVGGLVSQRRGVAAAGIEGGNSKAVSPSFPRVQATCFPRNAALLLCASLLNYPRPVPLRSSTGLDALCAGREHEAPGSQHCAVWLQVGILPDPPCSSSASLRLMGRPRAAMQCTRGFSPLFQRAPSLLHF